MEEPVINSKSIKNKNNQLFALKFISPFIFFVVIVLLSSIRGINNGYSRLYLTDTYYVIGILEYLDTIIQQNNSTINLARSQLNNYSTKAFFELINKGISGTDIENGIINYASRRYIDDYLDQLEQREGFRRDSLEFGERGINRLRKQFKEYHDEYFKNLEIFIKKDGQIGSSDIFLIGLDSRQMNMKRLEGFFTDYINKIDNLNHYYSDHCYHFRNKYWIPSFGGRVLSKKVIIY
ncbi:MAG: hypothetical protein LBI74_00335 [Synergistaceae bacterium]|nr:hypothetical protein [Synergistaceae bacterium]